MELGKVAGADCSRASKVVRCASWAVSNGDGIRLGCGRFAVRFARSICARRIGSCAGCVWISSLADSQCDPLTHPQAIVGGSTVESRRGSFTDFLGFDWLPARCSEIGGDGNGSINRVANQPEN